MSQRPSGRASNCSPTLATPLSLVSLFCRQQSLFNILRYFLLKIVSSLTIDLTATFAIHTFWIYYRHRRQHVRRDNKSELLVGRTHLPVLSTPDNLSDLPPSAVSHATWWNHREPSPSRVPWKIRCSIKREKPTVLIIVHQRLMPPQIIYTCHVNVAYITIIQ